MVSDGNCRHELVARNGLFCDSFGGNLITVNSEISENPDVRDYIIPKKYYERSNSSTTAMPRVHAFRILLFKKQETLKECGIKME